MSLLHEVGHQGLARLGLPEALSEHVGRAAAQAGASLETAARFSRWTSEIGPDYWAFGCSGVAQPFALREILALPAAQVLAVNDHDPHPPPRLRVELAFELVRVAWGRGPWEDARAAFLAAYPLSAARASDRPRLEAGRRALPAIARVLHEEPLAPLGHRALGSLFDFTAVHPERTRRIARGVRGGRLVLSGLRPAAHLAVFRWIHEERSLPPVALERAMTRWLVALGAQHRNVCAYPVWRNHA